MNAAGIVGGLLFFVAGVIGGMSYAGSIANGWCALEMVLCFFGGILVG